jgi:hypothetical protein
MITLTQSKPLGPGDLSLLVRDSNGTLIDPQSISYSIFNIDANAGAVLVSPPQAVPARASQGAYFANITIPTNWPSGSFEVRWYLKQYTDSNVDTITMDFTVQTVDPATGSFEAPSAVIAQAPIAKNQKYAKVIMQVRELLFDTNPDRNYHFRPPTPNKTVAGFTTRVGFIWTDATILRMIGMAISFLNWYNPKNIYNFTIDNVPLDWGNIAALKAAALCLSAEGARWAADGFSYSLNGVSLDLNKADLYQNLANGYNVQFTEIAPLVTANRPFSAGLRQQRWLLG